MKEAEKAYMALQFTQKGIETYAALVEKLVATTGKKTTDLAHRNRNGNMRRKLSLTVLGKNNQSVTKERHKHGEQVIDFIVVHRNKGLNRTEK